PVARSHPRTDAGGELRVEGVVVLAADPEVRREHRPVPARRLPAASDARLERLDEAMRIDEVRGLRVELPGGPRVLRRIPVGLAARGKADAREPVVFARLLADREAALEREHEVVLAQRLVARANAGDLRVLAGGEAVVARREAAERVGVELEDALVAIAEALGRVEDFRARLHHAHVAARREPARLHAVADAEAAAP